jgi:hypothetical protein
MKDLKVYTLEEQDKALPKSYGTSFVGCLSVLGHLKHLLVERR